MKRRRTRSVLLSDREVSDISDLLRIHRTKLDGAAIIDAIRHLQRQIDVLSSGEIQGTLLIRRESKL